MSRWSLILVTVTALTLTTQGADVARPKGAKAREVDSALFLAPLGSTINLKAGTLEARFALDYSFSEYLRPEQSSYITFYFLQIFGKDGTMRGSDETDPWISAPLCQGRGNNTLLFGTSHYYRESPGDPPVRNCYVGINPSEETGPWLKQGEWHALAATWELDDKGALQLELFLDGKSYERREFPIRNSKVRALAKDDLLGIGGQGLSPAIVLAYRLSNRVRTREEITSPKPLAADEATTFFMNGTTAAQCKMIKPAAYAKMRKEETLNIRGKGAFIGDVKFVNTPQGKAIQFYDKRSH